MRTAIFVNGSGGISPQQWHRSGFSNGPRDYGTNRLPAIEPDYSQWVSAQVLRRMSRAMKMGVGAAMMAVNDATCNSVNGVITGTGYGCLEDTGTFLTKVTTLNEEALNPTPFMQSTHNTIGSQIALFLQCRGYNQTYSQNGLSFEHALLDAMLQLEENPLQHFLVGGVEEITDVSHTLHSRFDKYRENVRSSLNTIVEKGEGTVAGEGAFYFVLSGEKGTQSRAVISGVAMLHRPDNRKLHQELSSFLNEHDLAEDEIDLVLAGYNGDVRVDRHIDDFLSLKFGQSSIASFKQLCGEHCVASAFATELAVAILENQYVPPAILMRDRQRPVKNILIYNTYFYKSHAFILLQACPPING
jgi:3-oxoacyl-(acyl-carrier-protein) synthase